MIEWMIGVDGGGSGCRAAVADRTGRILGRGRGGAANILSDRAGAMASIDAAIDGALTEAALGSDALSRAGVVLGLAGSNVGDGAAHVVASLPVAAAAVVSDALIALEGAFSDGDGAIVILGTGSALMVRRGGDVRSFGGWGFRLGDFGGGARIGQSVLAESLLAYDGFRPATPLTDRTLAAFADTPGTMVEFARTATPADFARFAPSAFEGAATGDPCGRRIVAEAAAAIDEGLDRVIADGDCPVALLGGLAPLYPDWLAPRHRQRLVAPIGDALSGALGIARRRFSAES